MRRLSLLSPDAAGGPATGLDRGGRTRLEPNDPNEEFKPMAFEVPPLPYEYDALEPHIDEATMRVHHDKHPQAYVDNANKALDGTDLDGKSVEEVLQSLDSLPSDKQGPVRN